MKGSTGPCPVLSVSITAPKARSCACNSTLVYHAHPQVQCQSATPCRYWLNEHGSVLHGRCRNTKTGLRNPLTDRVGLVSVSQSVSARAPKAPKVGF
jgi:hypothetical protein